MLITVPSVDAKAYQRMDGYEWAGAKLSIKREGQAGEEKQDSQTADVKAMLRGVLERRWNPDTTIFSSSSSSVTPVSESLACFCDSLMTLTPSRTSLLSVLTLYVTTVDALPVSGDFVSRNDANIRLENPHHRARWQDCQAADCKRSSTPSDIPGNSLAISR